ncbi:G-alpha-domain-containing protein [Mycena capillaripes]|nr:G-alpha-domain-containing protein [Mycena capillaripes]
MVARSQPSDPFSLVLQPPPNETPEERQKRIELEQEQKRVSDRIDDDLRKERAERKKQSKREVRVLLLGQSESGKSTVLKNFRLKYAPTQWKAELRSWRAVIQLNLIQNVVTILNVMQDRFAAIDSPPENSVAGPSSFISAPWGRTSIDSTITDLTSSAGSSANIALTEKHRLLDQRLSRLREVGDELRRRLGAGDEFTFANGTEGAVQGLQDLDDEPRKVSREFGVRGWVGALGLSSNVAKKADEPTPVDEPTEALATLRDDIISLWEDADVRSLLAAKDVRIEDKPGFFLSDTARITSRTYVPSDNDVVRARLRTLGVQEWKLTLETNDAFGSEWVIYDVGGSRSMRQAWLPYFDMVNAIIFLAPVSCFDERLAEDPSVNRLEDTMLLWNTIVTSPLLKKTTLIIFLNKCDLLKRKLQSGVRVNKYLVSFGNRENEVGVVVKYVKEKLKDMCRADTSQSEHRSLYTYATSVTDTQATAATLNIVRDSIIREHLKHADLV